MSIENIIPIVGVKDLHESIEFYSQKLGFKLDWGDEADSKVCSMNREGHSIMLSLLSEVNENSWVWIGTQNDEIFNEILQTDVEVVQDPTNNPWAYEMKVRDIDGNVLWFGTSPKEE